MLWIPIGVATVVGFLIGLSIAWLDYERFHASEGIAGGLVMGVLWGSGVLITSAVLFALFGLDFRDYL